ncbi:putative disease resistance RPP13-like protein 3 isoform X2 [Salvia hispanica]|uniref:putative disease resistance RPP13-like protein 3 isoform X2 n=1 Tax=Salvia hispanica TaxID=49212 RepID=UPI00200902B3|nr:putative disease resistance RPP13-like protein 3 isoform X2 [Salvia hispanica]
MADAAVEFLLENLKQLLVHHVYLIKDVKSDLEKLENDLRLFKAFLKDSLKRRRKDAVLRELGRQIQSVVNEAEDVIDSFVTHAADNRNKNFISKFWSAKIDIADQVDSVCRKIKDIYGDKSKFDIAFLPVDDVDPPERIEAPILRKHNVVGFEDEAKTLMGFLAEETDHLDVISIIGMPGLGKTTLAEFTKISEEISSKSNEELAGLVANHLANVKFLLVMDDVWAPADWEKLQIALPTSKKGKVLITSRLVEVGWYTNRSRGPHMLRFLNHNESCELLQLEVFGKREFPQELHFEGTEIAKRCCGLPLAIVVIGGILVKKFSANGDMSVIRRAWEKVTESFNTYLNLDNDKRMAKIISLSYEKLPSHLRECFLYVGMFPEDFEIPVWKLIRMWIAEGLIQRRDNISLEEIAESYLDDLINRNLVRAEKLKTDGRVKTCRVHDLLRDFCRTEAGNEGDNFFQVVKISDGGFQPPVYEEYKCRRLCIHSEVSRFLVEKPKGPTVRSFVCFSKDEVPIQPEYISAIPANFKLLRVLEAKPIKFTKLPGELYQLVHLRYIVLAINSTTAVLPSAFSKLWNIQTLIVDTTSRTLDVKVDIMNMIQLRHFKTNASATFKIVKNSKGGEQIQTLGTISPESCSEDVFSKARNLKKLGVRGKLAWLLENKKGSFDSLGKLGNLEKLKLINDIILCSGAERQLRGLPPAYKFPTKLRSLTLCDTSLDWAHMSVLASLDKLEVLKLKDKAFWGETWEATDGGFRHLEVLHIGRTNLKNWIASHHHFPRLNWLEIKNCEDLIEVPIQLADIPNFKLLDLHRSKNAAKSANAILGIKRRREDEVPANPRPFKLSIFPPEAEKERCEN